MPDRDDLDRMLDSALSTYAEPAPGFKTRLRRSIVLATRPQANLRRRWLSWAIALPVAACLVLLALTVSLHTRQPQTIALQQAPTIPPAVQHKNPAPSAVPAAARYHPTRSARSTSPTALAIAAPKRDVFPVPKPLTTEEQVLVAGASRGNPAERRQLVTAAKPPSDVPLAIADLTIPPLAALDEGKN